MLRPGVVVLLLCFIGVPVASAQVTEVEKISDAFIRRLGSEDQFGRSITSLGDLNEDGNEDLAVAAEEDSAVWILFMQDERTVFARHKIDNEDPVFMGDLEGGFGQVHAVANLGDLDGEGPAAVALAVGDDNDTVWILFLNQNGEVIGGSKIDTTDPILADLGLEEGDRFGTAVAALSDLDEDGVNDLAVGAIRDSYDSESQAGTVWVLLLRRDGTVKEASKINGEEGSVLQGAVTTADRFGNAIAPLDLQRDGRTDHLAVGAPRFNKLFVLALNPDTPGQVDNVLLISENEGGFESDLGGDVFFGSAVHDLGDPDGAGPAMTTLAVGAPLDEGQGPSAGAVWVVFLGPGLTVTHEEKLEGPLLTPRPQDQFGSALVSGRPSGPELFLYVGAPGADDGGSDAGAVWVLPLSLSADTVAINQVTRLSAIEGNVETGIDEGDLFGQAVASLGDLDGDGSAVRTLAVGAPGDDDEAEDAGAVWLLFLDADDAVIRFRKLSAASVSLNNQLDADDRFGSALASLDSDGDGVADELAVGAPGDDDGSPNAGAVWVFTVHEDGPGNFPRKLSAFGSPLDGLDADDRFGSALASLDSDGDGVADRLAVGAPGDDDGSPDAGAVWLLLNLGGSADFPWKLSAASALLTDQLDAEDEFGSAVAGLGDLDGDSIDELAVGAPEDDDAKKNNAGAVYVLFLKKDGSLKDVQKISATQGNFVGNLERDDFFGSALVSLGDVDQNGVPDLAVGAPGDADGGAVQVLYLAEDATVMGHQRISDSVGTPDSFSGGDAFSSALARLADNNESIDDLIVGAPGIDAIWLMFQDFNDLPVVGEREPAESTINEDILVKATVTDLHGVESVRISYGRAGRIRSGFATDEMDLEGGQWTFTISDDFATEDGVEYLIVATDSMGGTVQAPAFGIFSIQITIPGGLRKDEAQPFDTLQTAYRLISVPLDLDDKDPASVLENDLGEADSTRWRFFEPSTGVDPDPAAFIEYPNTSPMEPGKAFWLIVSEVGRTIGTGAGKTVRTDEPFEIPLEIGWNFVGNPFNFEIPVENLTLSSGASPDLRCFDDEDPCFPDVDPDGDRQGEPADWNTQPIGRIVSFEGYAVLVDTPDTLFINPDLSSIARLPPAARDNPAEASLWSIRIRAHSQRARDADNLAAALPQALDDWDRLDRAEPPRLFDDLSVYFPHPEWKKAIARYSTDARPAPKDGAVWPVEIVTARHDQVHLTFEGLADVPAEFEVWLVDDILNISQDLRQTDTYTVGGGGRGDPRPLKLVVGRPGFINGEVAVSLEIPDRFVLFPNFPNPFNPATMIRYGVPEASAVSLVIYNVLGRKVATLEAGREREVGYHAVVWDGRDDAGAQVASGVYFAQMRAGRFVQTQTMVLVK